MSYLTDLLHRRTSAKETLAKSVRFLRDRLGITVTDKSIDKAVHAADIFTDAIEGAAKAYIATTGLPLPAAILAAHIAENAFSHIDSAIATAGEIAKANN